MDLLLSDHTVLVTGASGGIGRALARVFAAEGARLVLHAHGRHADLAAWVAGQDWARRAVVVAADIRDPVAVSRAFEQGEAEFGRIDVAVANAGVWPRPNERLHEASLERLHHTIDVNLLGATWTARAWMQGLQRHGARTDGHGAALCFIGSTAGRFGEYGHADYSLAKAGLVGLVRTLKNECVDLDPYARVNMVEPGWTVTEMARAELEVPGNVARALRTMPVRQLARATDIARMAAFLCSPAARHVSGEVVTVAGGMEGRVRWAEGDVDEVAVRARARDGG